MGEPSPHSEIAPEPFAIVVGGAEVRVPIEKIFDAGPGELVVQRCMGSTAGRRGGTLFKSLEYAIVRFAPQLLLVLGESHSKIIGAALKQVSGASAPLAPMRAVLDQVMVSAMRAVTQMGKETAMTTAGREMKIRQLSVELNAFYTIEQLLTSPIIRNAVRHHGLQLHAAILNEHTGVVDFVGQHPMQSDQRLMAHQGSHQPGSPDEVKLPRTVTSASPNRRLFAVTDEPEGEF